MKFLMAYSGGKDCTLALDRMIRQGHQCVGLVVMVGFLGQYSYLHLFTYKVLKQYGKSLNTNLITVPSFELHNLKATCEAVLKAKKDYGAEAICSGDIDFISARKNIEKIAALTKLKSFFPLWHEDREKLLDELISKGYKCRIKCVDTNKLPKSMLGKTINKKIIGEFKKYNIDICGENGEYHTMVIDGPIFKNEIPFKCNKIHKNKNLIYLISYLK